MMYCIIPTRQGKKDLDTARKNGYTAEVGKILAAIRRDPYEDTPDQHFERLTGPMKGVCSRRINRHHRVVYTIHPNDKGLRDGQGNLYDGIAHIHEAWRHDYNVPSKIQPRKQ